MKIKVARYKDSKDVTSLSYFAYTFQSLCKNKTKLAKHSGECILFPKCSPVQKAFGCHFGFRVNKIWGYLKTETVERQQQIRICKGYLGAIDSLSL